MPKFRLNDAIGSLSAGIIMQLAQDVVIKSFKIYVYIWIYKNYHIIDLPWDSPITWWVCLVVYDFLYYWFHRAAHGEWEYKVMFHLYHTAWKNIIKTNYFKYQKLKIPYKHHHGVHYSLDETFQFGSSQESTRVWNIATPTLITYILWWCLCITLHSWYVCTQIIIMNTPL